MLVPYHTNFYFNISMGGRNGDNDAAVQEDSDLSKEMKSEELGCRGENRFKYRVPSTVTFSKLALKRGIAPARSLFLLRCPLSMEE